MCGKWDFSGPMTGENPEKSGRLKVIHVANIGLVRAHVVLSPGSLPTHHYIRILGFYAEERQIKV
jgi:hypothetical protein